MNKLVGKKFVLAKQFHGLPKEDNVTIVEEIFPPLQQGEYLCETVFLSVDPYPRLIPMELRDSILGYQIARIIESKTPEFPVGRYIVGYYGWKTHHIFNENSISGLNLHPFLIPDVYEDLPIQDFIGVLGLAGFSAYVGLIDICQPKPKETIVISAAAGAVGNVVGQIAKIKGCRVIGVVGSDEKGKWITNDLGFDGYINYKIHNITELLSNLAPNGVDMYFDNVGGEISSQIISQMNLHGRIAVCGSISSYNDVEHSKASTIQCDFAIKAFKMEGFHVFEHELRYPDIIKTLAQFLRDGKLKSKATITEGFENTFTAFCKMLQGGNIGKAIVKL